MATRSGVTTEDLLRRFALPQIVGDIPEGLRPKAVDDLTRELAAARRRRNRSESALRGRSLMDFVAEFGIASGDAATDRGGLFGRLFAGRSAKGERGEVSRIMGGRTTHRVGARSMVRPDGVSLDEAARRAYDAGYLEGTPAALAYRQSDVEGGERPDLIPAFLDLLEREARGEKIFLADQAAETSLAAQRALDDLEAYIASLGLSLDDRDEAIVAAIRDDVARSYAQRNRGRIDVPTGGIEGGEAVIRLFRDADLSTFLHESGHFFLLVMQRMAATEPDGAAARDLAVVKDWWRSNATAIAKEAGGAVRPQDVEAYFTARTAGDETKDLAIDAALQEQWARAFEAYLMEGRGPSPALIAVFERFRAWLVSIYRRLTGLGVQVSDELRGVFDRMLATDDEIADALASVGNRTLSAAALGMSGAEFIALQRLQEQASIEASARFLRKVMAPLKRQQADWWKGERAAVKQEQTAVVNAMPVYRAIEWLSNGAWLGGETPAGIADLRLSEEALVERYGVGIRATLGRSAIGGKRAVYTRGGADPDFVAGLFGFESGDQMVRAIERAQPRRAMIEAETDRVMRERHGDPLNDGALQDVALAAVHNEDRGQVIAAELHALSEVAANAGWQGTVQPLTHREAAEAARMLVATMKVRDAIAAHRFLAAERKAAAEAERLARIVSRERVWLNAARRRAKGAISAAAVGDDPRTLGRINPAVDRANATGERYADRVDQMIRAKRRQLLNYALFAEASKVAEEVESVERFVAGLSRREKRQKIAGAGRRDSAYGLGGKTDYLGAIDEILDRYDFRRMSGRAEDRRGKLADLVQSMREAGRENELAIPEDVVRDSQRAPYKTLSVEHLRGVIDSLRNLEHVALRWNDLVDTTNARRLAKAVDEIADAFEANMPARPPGRVPTAGEDLRSKGRQFLDLILNAATILREIDGFKDGGPAYTHIKAPIDAAMSRLAIRRRDAAAALDRLYSGYSKSERRQMAARKEVDGLPGLALSHWERIAVALNTGNAGNYQRLTAKGVPGSFTPDQVNAILATLDERDARFVQSVWDYLESFRPDVEARELRVTGVAPRWVEPQATVIAGVKLRGGYYPLRYDARLSALVRDDQQHEIASALQAGRFGKAQTRNGHLKERASASGRPIELDMSVLHRHVQQVVYDLELSEPVANAWKVLQHPLIRDSFVNSGRQADFAALEVWLKDVAEGELRSTDAFGRVARGLKSNFTAAALALNFATAAVQVTGLAQSMVVVGKRDMLGGAARMISGGVFEPARQVAEKSAFMATRQTTFQKDIYDLLEDPKAGPTQSRLSELRSNVVAPVGFWLMTKVQWHLVDVPTWLAGYSQGLRKFKADEAKAIAHADALVKRAQASGLFSDRTALERGSVSLNSRQSDVVRLFTALGSYMLAKANVAYERTARAGRVIGTEGVSLRSAGEVLSWTMDMAFLFTLEALLYAMIRGRLPTDDDDDDEGWAQFVARETALSVMSTIPLVRDVASAASGFEGGGAYGSITKGLAAPFTQLGQGEFDAALVKSIIAATGLATGLPATQLNRVVDAGWRQFADGDDVAPVEYLVGRGAK